MGRIRGRPSGLRLRSGQAEPQVGVAVAGVVRVAVGSAHVPGVVVPRAASDDPVLARLPRTASDASPAALTRPRSVGAAASPAATRGRRRGR